ncbi:MAG: response regulator transcription factor [Fimbriimonadaceae bacterium]|nr:response regulator transcription factor [Fimbriimonadaceae bacterium]
MANILVVDDDKGICDVLREALEHSGHFVTVANHGREGLQRLMERPFDLVMLDLRMPIMSGFEMLRSVRGTLKSQVPVIILTGYASIESLFQCTELGVSGYLPKPFRLDELETKVRQVLEGGLPQVSTLNRSARQKLSAREQEVLLLMRQGLTDQEIATRLFISPFTAHNHVKRIMQKLDTRNRAEAVALSFVEDVFDH